MQIITFFSQRYQRGFPGSELAEFINSSLTKK